MNTTISDRIIDIFNSNLPIIGSWGSKNYEPIDGGIEINFTRRQLPDKN